MTRMFEPYLEEMTGQGALKGKGDAKPLCGTSIPHVHKERQNA